MLAFAPNNPDRKHKSVSVSRQALDDMRWDMLDGLFPKEVIDINSDAGLVHDALLNWGRVLRRREFIWAVKRVLQNSAKRMWMILMKSIRITWLQRLSPSYSGGHTCIYNEVPGTAASRTGHCCRGHNDCKAENPRSAEIRPEILAARPQHLIARHKAVAKLQEKPHSPVIQ